MEWRQKFSRVRIETAIVKSEGRHHQGLDLNAIERVNNEGSFTLQMFVQMYTRYKWKS